MDPIEIEDWLRGMQDMKIQPVTIRTTDGEEIARFRERLPPDYRWGDVSELLQEGEKV